MRRLKQFALSRLRGRSRKILQSGLCLFQSSPQLHSCPSVLVPIVFLFQTARFYLPQSVNEQPLVRRERLDLRRGRSSSQISLKNAFSSSFREDGDSIHVNPVARKQIIDCGSTTHSLSFLILWSQSHTAPFSSRMIAGRDELCAARETECK